MGVALAEEARRRGAEVVLLAASLAVEPPSGVQVVAIPTAAAMLHAAEAAEFDLALLAAAVADYRPVEALATKRPKGDEPWTLELEPTTDIARLLGERKREGQVLVTFGAELGEEGLERKRRMLDEKNADLVVFNDVSRPDIGFDSAENEVVLLSRDGDRPVPKGSKQAVAAAILDEAERLLEEA
jgi:phosphopantothenoylcysteine decarboxylase/phosphopantothenate--cysteine ligase